MGFSVQVPRGARLIPPRPDVCLCTTTRLCSNFFAKQTGNEDHHLAHRCEVRGVISVFPSIAARNEPSLTKLVEVERKGCRRYPCLYCDGTRGNPPWAGAHDHAENSHSSTGTKSCHSNNPKISVLWHSHSTHLAVSNEVFKRWQKPSTFGLAGPQAAHWISALDEGVY